ncbi:MAG: histidine kinase dimerization/phosphoacceptor domain -containing protein [Bacteroidota bacterium]
MNLPIKILIVDDQTNDVELAKREIKQVFDSCEFASTETKEEYLSLLKMFQPDIVISDYSMPHFDGLSVIKLTHENAPLVPVIIFTGSIDEETAADSVKAGAVDYVIKENIKRLRQSVKNALEIKQMWIERIVAEDKLRASEERYRLISSVTSDYMFSTMIIQDGSLDLNWVAGAFESITGYNYDEYHSRGGWRAVLHPDDLGKDDQDLKDLKNNKKVVSEIRTINKNGSVVWVKVYAHPLWDPVRNTLIGIYGAVQNITPQKLAEEKILRFNQELESLIKERTSELEKTNHILEIEISERKKAEELIKLQLREKEILLKEIHHRVKNNMQSIVSILNLQMTITKNEQLNEILKDSQSRINTMSLIHEKLYQTKNFSNIDFADYINNLFRYLFLSFSAPEQNVKFDIDAESFQMEIDTSISLGLIANELVSNAFKYAFKGKTSSSIKVILKKHDNDNLLFSITDNGVGLPANFNFRQSKSLGLQLVCLLTEQLQGTIDVTSSDKGTAYTIIFPEHKE